MKIDGTEFGSITIKGKEYAHDVLIRLSGTIEKRKKKLSSDLYGTSHILSQEEAAFVFEEGARLLIVGTGQSGNLRLSPEAARFFTERDCRVVALPTPQAIVRFNEEKGAKAGLFHVTC